MIAENSWWIITYLIATFYKIGYNNFTELLSRLELSQKLTIEEAKERKKINTCQQCASDKKPKNDQHDISTWTAIYCRDFLNKHHAHASGNREIVQKRCRLVADLINCNLQHMLKMKQHGLKELAEKNPCQYQINSKMTFIKTS